MHHSVLTYRKLFFKVSFGSCLTLTEKVIGFYEEIGKSVWITAKLSLLIWESN